MDADPQARKISIVAYITIVGTVAAMFMNTEPRREYASFHIRQALGLNLGFYMLAYFIGYFNSWTVTAAFYIFFMVLWLFGFSGALQGKTREIPIAGRYFQQWFKNI